jgi:type VI secretion system protein ImpA
MASEDVLPFSELLAPIPGDNPAGSDLRASLAPDSEYRTLRRIRDAAGEAERQIDRKDPKLPDPPPPQWEPVVNLAVDVITHKSKDLDVTAYLIEGLVRVHGFAGLRDGFRLARELVEQYWEGLYPSDGGLEVPERFSKIIHLNGIDKDGTLVVPVRKIPFTSPRSQHQFSLAQYLQAKAAGQPTQKKGGDGTSGLDLIKKAVSEAEDEFYPNLVDDLARTRDEFRAFCEALKQKSNYDPPSSILLGLLQSYLDVVKEIAKEKLAKPAVGVTVTQKTDGEPNGPAGPADEPMRPGAIRTRQDALQQLRTVADYFRDREPQSVIPFALEQVIKWGNMSLPDLLAELIPEEGPRKNLFKQVGIRPPAPESR